LGTILLKSAGSLVAAAGSVSVGYQPDLRSPVLLSLAAAKRGRPYIYILYFHRINDSMIIDKESRLKKNNK